MHSPKIDLILCIKTEPVTVGADATRYVCILGQIFKNKAVHIPLHLLGHARFLCGDSDFIVTLCLWVLSIDTVQYNCVHLEQYLCFYK